MIKFFQKSISLQQNLVIWQFLVSECLELESKNLTERFIYLFILMILMREGDTPEGASPKGLGWPLHREKKKK